MGNISTTQTLILSAQRFKDGSQILPLLILLFLAQGDALILQYRLKEKQLWVCNTVSQAAVCLCSTLGERLSWQIPQPLYVPRYRFITVIMLR